MFLQISLLMLFGFNFLFENVSTETRMLDPSLSNKICRSFGEVSCPYDPYCVRDKRSTCEHCPNGGMHVDDCSWLVKSNWVEKCNSTDKLKFFRTEHETCTGIAHCPGQIENREYKCTSEYCKKTLKRRHFPCRYENRCVRNSSQCDMCRSALGGNDKTCTKSYCKNLTLTDLDERLYGYDVYYTKCSRSPKCILNVQWCDSIKDCPNNEDEANCTKEFCSDIGKMKCPGEEKCIENRFVCNGNTPLVMTHYQRNKCKYNLDCYESCFQKELTHFLCPKSKPFGRKDGRKDIWLKENCLLFNQTCIKPDPLLIQHFVKNKVWRCSENRNQYIPITSVCNQKFDCLFNEDESETICELLTLEDAFFCSVSVVIGLATLMNIMKSLNLFTHAWMCNKCMSQFRYQLTNECWNKQKRLLTYWIISFERDIHIKLFNLKKKHLLIDKK